MGLPNLGTCHAGHAAGVQSLQYTSPTYDVRVGNDPLWTDYNLSDLGSVSLREVLGGELVTFGEHIGPPLDISTPIPPKAVYVQCQQADPLTGALVPVVVPAQLCLDVFLDHSMGDALPEHELSKMSAAMEEQSDRRKLRSSIKGDPILMRSKPARPPEPYIAAASQEGQCLQAPVTRLHPSRASVPGARVSEQACDIANEEEEAPSSWPRGLAESIDHERLEGASSGGQSGDGHCEQGQKARLVEQKSTVSSFIKAGGRDRYCCPRLREIDSILERVSAEPRSDASVDYPPASASQAPGQMIAQLAAQMHRFPKFHERRAARRQAVEQHQLQADRQGNVQFNAAAHSRTSSGDRLSQEVSGTALIEGQSASSVPFASERPTDGDGAAGGAGQLRTTHKQERKNGKNRGNSARKLRLIDPHLPTAGLPTQRLHANWPFGIKREIARNFYGMTAEEVAAEEEHDRLVEEGGPKAWVRQTSSLHSKEELSLADEEAAAKPLSSRHGPQNNYVAHRLEVRVRNIDRPERFVVAKWTPRLRSKKEAMCRPMDCPCLELANAAARFHEEGAKSRSRCTVLYRDDVAPTMADAHNCRHGGGH
mmetsp:Transcript_22373/g.49537  ORF Transcript_22373/g.49537 Transcript_22373/m.49537 type:complete len:596 (+) Transcript_22373:66-1853(+)